MNHELPDVQAGFRKDKGTRDQIANIHWIIEKAREFLKNLYLCFIDYAKAFDCVDHRNLENPSRDGTIRPLTNLMGNLYALQSCSMLSTIFFTLVFFIIYTQKNLYML